MTTCLHGKCSSSYAHKDSLALPAFFQESLVGLRSICIQEVSLYWRLCLFLLYRRITVRLFLSRQSKCIKAPSLALASSKINISLLNFRSHKRALLISPLGIHIYCLTTLKATPIIHSSMAPIRAVQASTNSSLRLKELRSSVTILSLTLSSDQIQRSS